MRHAWGGEKPFGLWRVDRRQHLYAVGKTGTGKTTLLRNLIAQDIEAGHGVGVLDPHGDLAEELLDLIPPHRADDLVYFNPADLERPIGLNLLARVAPDRRPLAASCVVSIFKSIWRDSWGPRMEYILYNAAAALLDCEGATLLGLQRMLVDDAYRASVARRAQDPIVRAFWLEEFARYDRKFMLEAVAPIQNKIGQLLASPAVRNILGQPRSRIGARFMMDNRRILIANLAKGKLGEDKSSLLGSILAAEFQLAAMTRADVPEASREDFHLYIDEFQNFTTDAFISILSEARKYRLCLTLSHQYLGQLREGIASAVLGNAGSIVAFRVGSEDAETLARELGGVYAPRQLAELNNHEVCARLLDSGEPGEPFIGRTLPPWGLRHGRGERLAARSSEKYGRSREEIEGKLARWMRGYGRGYDFN